MKEVNSFCHLAYAVEEGVDVGAISCIDYCTLYWLVFPAPLEFGVCESRSDSVLWSSRELVDPVLHGLVRGCWWITCSRRSFLLASPRLSRTFKGANRSHPGVD